MNDVISKVVNLIDYNMKELDNTYPTANVVYDALVQEFPKIRFKYGIAHEYIRKAIVTSISDVYDDIKNMESMVLLILRRIIDDCEGWEN